MIDWNDPLSVLSIIIPIIAGSIASVYYINKIIQDQKDRKPVFGKFQRKGYIDGSWVIFLHSPSKPIARCNVTFRDEPLLLQDKQNYEKSMALGEGANFLMPSNISKEDDGKIMVRDGKKKIYKETFNTIPLDVT